MIEGSLKWVFYIIGTVVAALLLYNLFFVGEDSAVNTMYRSLQVPFSEFYYTYCAEPALLKTQDADKLCGFDYNPSHNPSVLEGDVAGYNENSSGFKRVFFTAYR